MLEELEIENATLDLKYDKYIYEYTVEVNSNIDHLEFKYKICDDCFINIKNNTLINNNQVIVEVFDYDNKDTYVFNTYKENNSYTLQIEDYMNRLEANKESINILYVQLLSISIFMLIIIIFSLLFRRSTK